MATRMLVCGLLCIHILLLKKCWSKGTTHCVRTIKCTTCNVRFPASMNCLEMPHFVPHGCRSSSHNSNLECTLKLMYCVLYVHWVEAERKALLYFLYLVSCIGQGDPAQAFCVSGQTNTVLYYKAAAIRTTQRRVQATGISSGCAFPE